VIWALGAACVGLIAGWLVRGVWEITKDANTQAERERRIVLDAARVAEALATSHSPEYGAQQLSPSAATPGPRETHGSIFETKSGHPVESPLYWDKRRLAHNLPAKIAYEELEGMFLDQFLLRYFPELMETTGDLFVRSPLPKSNPWDLFCQASPWKWTKYMPLLFEQMTGYSLNEIQLNNAIAEWARRVSKSPIFVAPGIFRSVPSTCPTCHGNPMLPNCPKCGETYIDHPHFKSSQRADTLGQHETQKAQ